jgi:hypothetical protein
MALKSRKGERRWKSAVLWFAVPAFVLVAYPLIFVLTGSLSRTELWHGWIFLLVFFGVFEVPRVIRWLFLIGHPRKDDDGSSSRSTDADL